MRKDFTGEKSLFDHAPIGESTHRGDFDRAIKGRISATVNFEKSKILQRKSHVLIPGGCHTYAKGDDQYPVNAPGFIARGDGCRVWDVDGNEFIEYGMGLRSVTLGHAYSSVLEAAHRQMLRGTNFTRPTPIEVECAEAVLNLYGSAEMVKFGKNGSDVTTAAVKIARACTGRDMVAICGDQPFFSVDDWFIGSTAMSAGIPEAIRNLTVKFPYNDLDGTRSLFLQYPGRIACIVMEAETMSKPQGNYLQQMHDLCRENGALFVLDEMITGFRWHLGGAQTYYGITPDLFTLGKGMGNGFSISALAGKKEFLEIGGLNHDGERVFLLSTTHGAETHALAACLKTMEIYRKEDVVGYLWQSGQILADGVERIAKEQGIEDYFQLAGRKCNLVYIARDEQKQPSQVFRTLFLQEMIKRGVIAPSLVVSYSHKETDIARTLEAVRDSLAIYARALQDGPGRYLEGRPVKPVFRKFN
jgi:glutamate-1-semialdehyde 2,1-aminomutase